MSFGRYIAIRAGSAVATFFITVVFTFFLFRILPGNPVAILVNPDLPPDARAAAIQSLGLNLPLPQQFYVYFAGILQGRLGTSIVLDQPVWNVLMARMGNTLFLAGAAALIIFSLTILIGLYTGLMVGKRQEKIITGIISALGSAPLFVLGLLAILVFALWMRVLPYGLSHSVNFTGTGLSYYLSLDYLRHLALPAFTLALGYLVFYYLIMKNSVEKLRTSDFVEYLQARGAKSSTIKRHILRNSLLPLTTVMTNYAAFALGGQVVVETVFSWLGLGFTIIQAVDTRDFPLLQGAFLLIALVAIIVNFVSDLVYVYVDPRVKFD